MAAFPLPEITAERVISLYGQFTDAELAGIVSSNAVMTEDGDPVHHLLACREQPLLTKYNLVESGLDHAVAYRTAICVGATMVRRYAGSDPELLQTFSSLRADPDRSYLKFADMDALVAARRFTYWPMIADDFTHARHYLPYLERVSSHDYIQGLREQLIRNRVRFMSGSEDGRLINFGFFCSGLVDTLQLYDTLEREARVAPASETEFDPVRHELLVDAYTPAPSGGLAKRWRTGGLYPEGTHEQPVAYRAVAGYVMRDGGQTPVVFRASEQRYTLSREGIVLAHDPNHHDITAYDFRTYPFTEPGWYASLIAQDRGRTPGHEPILFLQDGHVRFLRDPILDEEDGFLFAQGITLAGMEGDRHRGKG